MRPAKLFAILVLGLAGCPDWESLQTDVPDMLGQNTQDMPASGDMMTGTWTSVYTSTGVPLNAISGAAGNPDTITAVGNAQTYVRGNGSTFMAATVPLAGTNFQALWVNGAMEIWAAGSAGQVWQTTNSGTIWIDRASGTTFTLRGIFARNGNDQDIVVAGEDADNGRHWNGIDWQDARHGRGDQMYGVWASNQNFWVVGSSGDGAISANPRVFWNNISDVSSGARMNAVSGLDDANVWGVTDGGGLYKYDAPMTQWNSVANVTGQLRAMWIRSANEIWIAGGSGGNGVVYRCDAVARTCTNQSTAALNQYTVTGIWGNGQGGIWVTANSGQNGVIFRR